MSKRRDDLEEERRTEIIAAARKCFSEKGFHGTSMRSIFAEANLSSGSFYNYFTSKTEVVREAMTGTAKFSDDNASATHMMKFGEDGSW